MTIPFGPSGFRIRPMQVFSLQELETIRTAARDEGFHALDRLIDDWQSGENRFDAAGEALFEARVDDALVGVCGLNRDPWARLGGRVRRLFVLPEYRRSGIGRALVNAVREAASSHFDVLHVRTHDPLAAAFYRSLGFSEESAEHSTHWIELEAG